jgi:biotin transporter BioY
MIHKIKYKAEFDVSITACISTFFQILSVNWLHYVTSFDLKSLYSSWYLFILLDIAIKFTLSAYLVDNLH